MNREWISHTILANPKNKAADLIAQAHEQDKWDALQGVDAAWHSIEDGHLAEISRLKGEIGKAQDLLGAAYGLLRRAQEEEGDLSLIHI